MQLLITDIDGVLADPTHRLEKYILNREQKDWGGFYSIEMADDKPIQEHIDLVFDIFERSDMSCVVTGRPERTISITELWLNKYCTGLVDNCSQIYVREDGDHRPADEVKCELVVDAIFTALNNKETNGGNGEDVVTIVEDSPNNLKAMEKAIHDAFKDIKVVCVLLGTGRYDQFNCCGQCTSCGSKDEPGKSGRQCSQS